MENSKTLKEILAEKGFELLPDGRGMRRVENKVKSESPKGDKND